MINAGANLLHGLWEGISGAASWLWEKVSGWASSLVSGIKDFFGIHSPSTVFAEIGGNMADGVGVGFTDNMGGVEGDMTAAMGGAGALTAAEAVNAVNNGIIANIEGLSGAVNAIVERVITGLTAQAQRFNQAGQDFDKNIASGMVAGIVQITQKVPQIAQSIITAFTAQHQKFVTEGTNIDKSIAQGMIAGIPQITGKVAQIIQPVITALRSYVSEFTAAGEEMVRGIWQGFQNMSGWLESRVRSMMRDIVAAVEEEMDINSPSKVFARIGSYMAQGLGEASPAKCATLKVRSGAKRRTPFRNSVPERDATRAAAVRLPLKSCKTSMRTKRATPNSKDRRRGSSGRLRGRLWHEDTRKIDLHERARGKHRVFPRFFVSRKLQGRYRTFRRAERYLQHQQHGAGRRHILGVSDRKPRY
jgi:phage-related protein